MKTLLRIVVRYVATGTASLLALWGLAALCG